MALPYAIRREAAEAIAGIDEAGRGPLAGPVVAAAVILEEGRLPRKLARRIDDSKKLTIEWRETLFVAIGEHAAVGIGVASVEEIDAINILQASHLAMRRAFDALPIRPMRAVVDGDRLPGLPCPAEPVIGGDGLILEIAAASIIAKVTRDRLMAALASEHPGYGWEHNRGYGTPEHCEAISRLGVTPHHRRTFAPVRSFLESS